jgi:hypothetical protein
MKINELQMPQEDLFNNEDVKAIINQEVNGSWSEAMTAEEFMAFNYKILGITPHG